MWKRLSNGLVQISRGWVVLSAVVIFLLFTALVLPAQSAKANTTAGDAGSPDTSFFYSVTDLYRMAEAYGPEGRTAYIRVRFTFDLIWPVVYTLFLTTTISWVYARISPTGSRWRWLNLTPVIGALLDYLENISTSLVMARYPAHTPVVDFLAPLFTTAKWAFVGGSMVILVIGLGVGLWQWGRRIGQRETGRR